MCRGIEAMSTKNNGNTRVCSARVALEGVRAEWVRKIQINVQRSYKDMGARKSKLDNYVVGVPSRDVWRNRVEENGDLVTGNGMVLSFRTKDSWGIPSGFIYCGSGRTYLFERCGDTDQSLMRSILMRM